MAVTTPTTMGHTWRVGVGPLGGPANKRICVLEASVGCQGEHLSSDLICGTADDIAEQTAEGQEDVTGSITLEPRPDELEALLPFISGTTKVGNDFQTGTTPTPFYLIIDKGADIYEYNIISVARATFRSAPGGKLQLVLDLLGITETPGATFPAIDATISTQLPYVHHQLVENLAGTARFVDDVETIIDWNLLTDRFGNSQTRCESPSGGLIVNHNVNLRFTADEAALYDIAIAGIDGSSTWTNGPDSFAMTYGKLQAPKVPIVTTGRREEVRMPKEFVARRDQTNTQPAVFFTNIDA